MVEARLWPTNPMVANFVMLELISFVSVDRVVRVDHASVVTMDEAKNELESNRLMDSIRLRHVEEREISIDQEYSRRSIQVNLVTIGEENRLNNQVPENSILYKKKYIRRPKEKQINKAFGEVALYLQNSPSKERHPNIPDESMVWIHIFFRWNA